jgi:hypothetical protein
VEPSFTVASLRVPETPVRGMTRPAGFSFWREAKSQTGTRLRKWDNAAVRHLHFHFLCRLPDQRQSSGMSRWSRTGSQREAVVGSPEQHLARWVMYAVLVAPMIAILCRDLGVGPVGAWVSYAIIAAPIIAMLSHREINVDHLVRLVLYTVIALTAISS